MYLVYKTDARHSYASRDIIGIATEIDIAVLLCIQQSKKEDENLEEQSDQIFNLHSIKQTQGYLGEGEFQVEEIEPNVLL